MTRRLVFIHGRSQEFQDPSALKRGWIEALKAGLAKIDLALPVKEMEIAFPYYGQALYDLVDGKPPQHAAEVIVRGNGIDGEAQTFLRAVANEIQTQVRIPDASVFALLSDNVIQRGPLNWEWVQAILKAIDQHVPGGSGASIALATHDVYQYLNNTVVSEEINEGVQKAIQPGVPTVVVSHSLGTVVAYNLLKQRGVALGWNVPLFVTLGSPLAITAIRSRMRPLVHPSSTEVWFNAMDERDVVALYPLDRDHFDVSPSIVNKTDVRNNTENRHGISGYLSDSEVARRIHDALTVR
jgi:hypothetical protein